MRVRVAYISSLGTTAILVAAAFTLLTVVGTIVAFKGWPGSVDSSGVQSVPLAPGGTPARAALVRRVPAAQHVVRKAPAHASARQASTAGLVKTAGTGKQIVPGLIMVPVHAAPPLAAQPVSGSPRYPEPVSGSTTPRDLPSGNNGPGPVPATGNGITLPSLNQSVPPPPDPVSTLAGGLLSGGPPPPLHLHVR